MDEKEFGIEYLKLLRSEMEVRIRNQSYFTISKIVACAGLFGHLSKGSFSKGLVAVPLLAVLLDFVIHHNLAIINSIGGYIRNELERKCFKDMIAAKWVPYESAVGQTQYARVRDFLDRFGQIGITATFFLLAVLIFTLKEPWNRISVSIWGIVLALFVGDIVIAVLFRACPAAEKSIKLPDEEPQRR